MIDLDNDSNNRIICFNVTHTYLPTEKCDVGKTSFPPSIVIRNNDSNKQVKKQPH